MSTRRLYFFDIFRSFYSNRDLILQLTKRDIIGRYRGSSLGILWALITPLLMLAIYTIIFGVVFQAKWSLSTSSKGEFAIILFCGLMVFTLFSECVSRAPTLVLNNPNYVKKVVFPLEILTWVSILSAVFNLLMSFLILVVGIVALTHTLSWTILCWPLVLVPIILITAGISWFLASLGVFVRDIGYMTGIAINILLYMSPIFYPISAVPVWMQSILRANPLSYVIEDSRKVILWNQLPDWYLLGAYSSAGLIVAWLGFVWFQKTRKGFADVL